MCSTHFWVISDSLMMDLVSVFLASIICKICCTSFGKSQNNLIHFKWATDNLQFSGFFFHYALWEQKCSRVLKIDRPFGKHCWVYFSFCSNILVDLIFWEFEIRFRVEILIFVKKSRHEQAGINSNIQIFLLRGIFNTAVHLSKRKHRIVVFSIPTRNWFIEGSLRRNKVFCLLSLVIFSRSTSVQCFLFCCWPEATRNL